MSVEAMDSSSSDDSPPEDQSLKTLPSLNFMEVNWDEKNSRIFLKFVFKNLSKLINL